MMKESKTKTEPKAPLKLKIMTFDRTFDTRFNEFSQPGIEVKSVQFKKDGRWLNLAFIWYREV